MEALACDVLNDDLPLDPGRSYLYALAREARALGLTTGILWGVPSLGMRNQTWSAVMANDLVSAVKIGFDPTHVQVTGLTPMEAKAGKRP